MAIVAATTACLPANVDVGAPGRSQTLQVGLAFNPKQGTTKAGLIRRVGVTDLMPHAWLSPRGLNGPRPLHFVDKKYFPSKIDNAEGGIECRHIQRRIGRIRIGYRPALFSWVSREKAKPAKPCKRGPGIKLHTHTHTETHRW